jgi:hypothetical protein
MSVVQMFQKEIISAIFTLLIAGAFYLFRAKVELVWSSPHSFNFLLKRNSEESLPTLNLRTESIFVRNTGKIPATEMEIIFNFPPENYNIWPVRTFETYANPDGRFTLKFPNLAPKEGFQIELLTFGDLPGIISLRSKECVGKSINMYPVRIPPRPIRIVVAFLVYLGIACVIYGIVRFIYLLSPYALS